MPDKSAQAAPALWRPDIAATVVLLAAAEQPGPGTSDTSRLDTWPLILADRRLSDGRHLVLGDRDALHRVYIRHHAADAPLDYIIIRDAAVDLRHAAAQRLDRRLAGAPPARLPSGFQPTAFRRQRLSMLLDILDSLLDPNGAPATTHDIACRHVYRAMAIPRGSAWKASSERRRTQRLIDESRALMEGDYRRLLRG